MKNFEKFTIRFNRSRRTYTIRKYINGKCVLKARSFPQSRADYSEQWTQADICQYLHYAATDYYIIERGRIIQNF